MLGSIWWICVGDYFFKSPCPGVKQVEFCPNKKSVELDLFSKKIDETKKVEIYDLKLTAVNFEDHFKILYAYSTCWEKEEY